MAEINVNTNSVKAIANNIGSCYSDIEEKFKSLLATDTSSYWSSNEADSFKEQLSQLDTMIKSFNKKYSELMASLSNITNSYDEGEQALLAALDDATKEKN